MTYKVFFINYKGLDSSIQKGFIDNKSILESNYNLVEIKKKDKIKFVKAENVYLDENEANFYLDLYLAKREFKLQQVKDDKCNCMYCGKTLKLDTATVDHIKPLSKYPELALSKSNFTIACVECNQNKSSKGLYEFYHSSRKGQMKRENYAKRKTEKICRNVRMNSDNVYDIAKQDSRSWNVKLFFNKRASFLNVE